MKKRNAALVLAAVGATALTAGCATGPERKPGDPLEPMNRAIFKFNDTVDQAIAVPIAKGYQKVTPQPFRTAVSNFFSNLGDISNFANDLLQLKITDATEDLMRVAFNSTFGLGGLLDWATPAGLPKHKQDFGLTLGRWGIPSGPYLVLPIFGPSSFRDSVGLAVDVRFNPMNYMEPAVRNPMYGAQFVSVRSDLLGASSLLEQAALDKYSFVRDAYTQQRKSLLKGSSAPPALPDYGDPGASDDGDTGAAAGAGSAAGGAADVSAASGAAAGGTAASGAAAESAPAAGAAGNGAAAGAAGAPGAGVSGKAGTAAPAKAASGSNETAAPAAASDGAATPASAPAGQ
ncbi:MlaA family lipoprotein [Paraburkholderia kururiensis]|uniref:MlaA family lipoprotein n=1 Tax=Paraburkholderia kururiensis TaxID=984307 RepID=UPI0018F588A6|nr:VacJ family lipoprotein [Paraburkholderia kururiensis]